MKPRAPVPQPRRGRRAGPRAAAVDGAGDAGPRRHAAAALPRRPAAPQGGLAAGPLVRGQSDLGRAGGGSSGRQLPAVCLSAAG